MRLNKPLPATILLLLAFLCARAADLKVADSPMYGRVAILSEGNTRLELALTEGARIISWKVNGQELGFVGRIWGGDMYDRIKDGDTRFQPPTSVETQQQGELVAIRARFKVSGYATLSRIIALSPEGFFLEAEFTGTDNAWYAFAPHLIRNKLSTPQLAFFREGKIVRQDLKPKEKYENLPAALAVTGLCEEAFILHSGEGMGVKPRVWNSSMSLDLGGIYRQTPLRVNCTLVPPDRIAQALETRPIFPTWGETWQKADFRVPEPPRPQVAEIARSHGPYGTCNSKPNYMAPLAASGLRWVRSGSFSWATCEALPGQRDYSSAETLLAATEREGLAVIGEMSGNPGWATTDGNRRSPPKDWNAWERHVEQTVARFCDRVHVWEIWNEPDISQFWAGSAEDYVQLLKHAYRGAKRADPNCLVMSAGLDGSGEAFLAKILDLGAGEFCDLVGAHPYAGTSAIADFRMQTMRRILAYHKLDKPLWITEVGWQSGGWKGGPGVVGSEEIKAQRLTDSYPALGTRADVVCWYVGVEPGRMYGLLQPTGKNGFILNPAWFAMRDLALPPNPAIRIETAKKVTLQAGKPTKLKARVHGDQDLQIRWLGLEPGWDANPAPIILPAKTAKEITLDITTPAYIRPEQRHVILAIQDMQGRHLANQSIELNIENPGKICDFTLGGGWIRRIGADGKDTGPWKPAHSLCSTPGEGFVQPLRPRNRGNFELTLELNVDGTAAQWLDPVPKTITVAPGKTGWIALRIRVPATAKAGTYTLNANARSKTFPAVEVKWKGSYSVVSPPQK